MASPTWALSHLARMLPLDEQSLNEILAYTSSLSKEAAAEHLRDILGTSPNALEFITSFNSRREAPHPTEGGTLPAPDTHRKPRKKKAPLNKPFKPRQPEDYGKIDGAYQKKAEEDYMVGSSRIRKDNALANTLALSEKPEARQIPAAVFPVESASLKKPPSASGPLISDLPNARAGSRNASRTSSPTPKTTVKLSGGTPMQGTSSALQDLDSAIRALEIQTNPSLSANEPLSSRACSCLATRHPLLVAAPNCLNCGKIVCVKEGIGPCTFCSHPLLTPTDIHAMIKSLREERGREKMSVNNASHKRADLASTPRNLSSGSRVPSSHVVEPSLVAAQQHRDKLLDYQAQNTRRTHIIDEVADFETPSAGQNMWSSPVERAEQLKRQQKVLREQEWNAKPEWQKRQIVLSVDVKGGKAVRRMAEVERPKEEENEGAESVPPENAGVTEEEGAFSRNPLMGQLIRPVWKAKGNESISGGALSKPSRSKWRRVQDDDYDNEAWILDGGVYGGKAEERRVGEVEHAKG
ncbi:MAG: hypothetical protein Q9214_001761 [Letrouitia sp. 1 TL-2023]